MRIFFVFSYFFTILLASSHSHGTEKLKKRFELIGTIISNRAGNNIAIIRDLKEEKTKILKQGKKLDKKNNIYLNSIDKNQITISHNSKKTTLPLYRKTKTPESHEEFSLVSKGRDYSKYSFEENLEKIEKEKTEEKQREIKEAMESLKELKELKELRTYFETEKSKMKQLLKEEAIKEMVRENQEYQDSF